VSVAAPKVTNVYVSGSTWSTSFKNFLAAQGVGDATYGYNIAGGVNQLKDLPWTNLNQISIKFDSDVNVTQASLVVKGVNTALYGYAATGGFTYDSTTHVATWKLDASILRDKMLFELASAGVTLKSDPTVTLDGEYTTSTTTGSSGDGVAGGDFNFRANVLSGDVNQTSPVNNSDVSLVKNRQGTILPAADPTPAAPVASSAVTAPVVASKPVAKFAVKRIKKNDLLN